MSGSPLKKLAPEVYSSYLEGKGQKNLDLTKNCEYLSRFYLSTRYPDAMVGSLPEGLPNREDATRAVIKAEPVLEFVKNLLS
ncbi:MAG: HEPN domain-containing protein [bacterium]